MKTELAGNVVHLRPLQAADMRRRTDWTADDELVSLMGVDPTKEPFISTEYEEQRDVDWLQDRLNAGDRLYAIEIDGHCVGDLDVVFFPDARKAEMTVFIGDRCAWGKGCGTESVRLVVQELRPEPSVDRVEVDVSRGNDRSLVFWENLGFQEYKTDNNGRRWLRLSFEDERKA